MECGSNLIQSTSSSMSCESSNHSLYTHSDNVVIIVKHLHLHIESALFKRTAFSLWSGDETMPLIYILILQP